MRKNYLNFISLSKFLSFYSENIIIFLLPIITYRFFHKIEDSGLIIFFHFLFRLLGYPVSGILCDRLDEKKIITAVAFIRGIFFLSLFSLYNLWNPENHSLLFILLSFLSSADGFAGGVASIAFETTGPKLYPHSKFRDFQVSTQTADQCALLLAPATGAFILDAFGSSLTLATVSTLFLCSGITFLPCLKLKNIETDPNLPMMINSGGLIQTPLDTVRAILKNRLILITLGMTILDNFLLGLYSALLVPLSLNIFHESEKNLGWVLTFGYFASMGAIHWSHWIQKKKINALAMEMVLYYRLLRVFSHGISPKFYYLCHIYSTHRNLMCLWNLCSKTYSIRNYS